MTPARSGSLIGATWLIGLGAVFLIRELADLSWGEAWPLFIVLIGVATLVSAMIRHHPGIAGIWDFTWPVAWIVVGLILLASTTGVLGVDTGDLTAEWWPWVLVILGVWFLVGAFVPLGGAPDETLVLPLDGATEADIRVKFGAGELTTRAAAPGNLVDGAFAGGVTHRLSGPGRIELEQDTTYGLPWLDHRAEWTIGLTTEIPLDLRFDTGAARTVLDLRDLRVRSLEVHTGASETRILLPRAAGATAVRAEAGAASLTIEVPTGVAARIRSRVALGSSQVDQARFPRVGDAYESPDYATAANRVDIDMSGGVGSLRVIGGT